MFVTFTMNPKMLASSRALSIGVDNLGQQSTQNLSWLEWNNIVLDNKSISPVWSVPNPVRSC